MHNLYVELINLFAFVLLKITAYWLLIKYNLTLRRPITRSTLIQFSVSCQWLIHRNKNATKLCRSKAAKIRCTDNFVFYSISSLLIYKSMLCNSDDQGGVGTVGGGIQKSGGGCKSHFVGVCDSFKCATRGVSYTCTITHIFDTPQMLNPG